jgi:hypothetical protein
MTTTHRAEEPIAPGYLRGNSILRIRPIPPHLCLLGGAGGRTEAAAPAHQVLHLRLELGPARLGRADAGQVAPQLRLRVWWAWEGKAGDRPTCEGALAQALGSDGRAWYGLARMGGQGVVVCVWTCVCVCGVRPSEGVSD